jgi:hypothetical protein
LADDAFRCLMSSGNEKKKEKENEGKSWPDIFWLINLNFPLKRLVIRIYLVCS